LVDIEDIHIKNTGQTGLGDQSVNFSHPFAIKLPKNCTNIPENWLTFEKLALANCGTGLDKMGFHDPSGNKMSIRQFVEEYEETDILVLYFSKPTFQSYHSEVFGDMKYLDGNGEKDAGNYRTGVSVPFVLHSAADKPTGDIEPSQTLAEQGYYANDKPPPRPPMRDDDII
jgi:hypothetical protein